MEPDPNYDPDDELPTPSIDDGFNPELRIRRQRFKTDLQIGGFVVMALLLITLLIALSGCAKYTTPITQTEVYQLGNTYGVLQSAAVTYDSFPVCNEALGITKLCRTKEISALLAKYDAAFNTAYVKLVDFTRNPKNYPGLSFTQLYQAAATALTTFHDAEAAYNIGKVTS